MCRNKKIELTDEKFQEIYTDEKLRNAVAYAHGVRSGNEAWLKAMIYPIDYKVTQQQKELALAEILRAKQEKLETLGNKLVFVGMGMTYSGDDVGNYRIRTEFKNAGGLQFFIELSSAGSDSNPKWAMVHHAIYRELTFLLGEPKEVSHDNYKNLEYNSSVVYTKESILEFINKNFGCSFKEMEVDNYTFNCEEFVCQSPAKN